MFDSETQCEPADPLQGRSHSVRSAGVHKLLGLVAQGCSASTRGAQGPASEWQVHAAERYNVLHKHTIFCT